MQQQSTDKLKQAFISLGYLLQNPTDKIVHAVNSAQHQNAWFTPTMVNKSLSAIGAMLKEEDLNNWFKDIKTNNNPKKIGLVLAGNIPLVGFHDILCVLATGNIALIKLSSSDDKLLPILLNELASIEPSIKEQIIYTERLKDFDAVIATGSNNSARYFEYYFSKVPHIIRKNRNSIAILDGTESTQEIESLGNDIFDYFGLGCRNVSKVFLPQQYNIKDFFEPLEVYQPIIHHFKYNNNYDYNKSIYLVNGVKHYDNGFLLVKEDPTFTSPLSVIFIEYYDQLKNLELKLTDQLDSIQCIIGKPNLNLNLPIIDFGKSQLPKLWDYADNMNTIDFLNKL